MQYRLRSSTRRGCYCSAKLAAIVGCCFSSEPKLFLIGGLVLARILNSRSLFSLMRIKKLHSDQAQRELMLCDVPLFLT